MSKFTFSKTNLSKYCIVYPKYNMSYLVTLELEKLRKAVKKITDKDIIMYPDNKEHAYEIVVDEVCREQAPTGSRVLSHLPGKLTLFFPGYPGHLLRSGEEILCTDKQHIALPKI